MSRDSSEGIKNSLVLLGLLAAVPFGLKLLSFGLGSNNYLGQSSYKLGQLAVVCWWRWKVSGKSRGNILWPLDLPFPSRNTWLIGLGMASFSILSAALLIPWGSQLLELSAEEIRARMDERFAMTPWRAVGVVIYLAAINSALEELHFRAWLDPELSKRLGAGWGIGISATLFGVMHVLIFSSMENIPPIALLLVFLALAFHAVMWSWLARRPGGIHAAWLTHGLTDAGFLVWGLFWLGYFP